MLYSAVQYPPVRYLLAVLLLVLLAVTVLLANFCQMLSVLLLPFGLFRPANRFISGAWFGLLRWSVEVVLGVQMRRTGDSFPWRENAFLLSNHQAMSDIPAIISLAHRSGRRGDLKWFVKNELKWVPGIGWGMQFLDCLFVKRNWTADKRKVEETFSRIRNHDVPFWVVSFLEGTRATPAKLARSQAFAAKSGLPRLHHVLLPRTKGFEASLEGLGDKTQAIYDVTIGYEGPPPWLPALFFGPVRCIHLHCRRFTEWPRSREERNAWVIKRFQEKDELLAYFHRHGNFPV